MYKINHPCKIYLNSVYVRNISLNRCVYQVEIEIDYQQALYSRSISNLYAIWITTDFFANKSTILDKVGF